MSTPVLPQSNVNDDAVPWARKITDLAQGSARDLVRVSQDLEMSNRATAGQMGVIGRQLSELQARSSHQGTPEGMTLVYGTGFGQKGPVTSNFEMPGPSGGGRTATLVGSGVFEWAGGTSTSAVPIYLRLEVIFEGLLVSSAVEQVSASPFLPAEFGGNAFSAVASLQVPYSPSASFELKLYGYRSASGGTATDAGRVRSLSFTMTYGDIL